MVLLVSIEYLQKVSVGFLQFSESNYFSISCATVGSLVVMNPPFGL